MLTIRPQQMAALGAYARDQFEANALREMMEEWPEEAERLGEDALRLQIKAGVTKAMRYGIEARSDVLDFLSLMMEWGPDFEMSPAYPWAQVILAAKNPGTLKIQQLEARFDPLRILP
jgi:hypothetical protein